MLLRSARSSSMWGFSEVRACVLPWRFRGSGVVPNGHRREAGGKDGGPPGDDRGRSDGSDGGEHDIGEVLDDNRGWRQRVVGPMGYIYVALCPRPPSNNLGDVRLWLTGGECES